MSDSADQSIDFQAYNSVVAVIEESFARFPDKPMFTCMGKDLSYSEVDRLSSQFAAYLQQHTGLVPGDRIAIQLPNLLQYPIVVYGAMRAGLVVVNTNPLYTPRETLHQFNDSGAKALVVLADLLPAVEKVVPDTGIERVIVTNAIDMLAPQAMPETSLTNAVGFLDALSLGEQAQYQPVSAQLEDIALLQYTGGTTGVSKGAMLTHGNLVANMLQGRAALMDNFQDGEEVYIVPLPLYHIYAFTLTLVTLPSGGQLAVLIPNPRDLDAFVAEMKRRPFSGFAGLNTLFVSLCHHDGFKALDFSRLKLTNSGGMALNKDTSDLWISVTQCPISEGYGLTETSPMATYNPLDAIQVGTVGIPCVATELKVIDEAGVEQPIGERGELCIRGPQVMKGYWQRPEATEEVISEDGWFKTGDVAVIQEDGYVRIVDRIKDMVIVSGFNVFPNEIEDVVMLYEGVRECAVIGVDDERSGQAVKLFLVSNDPDLTADQVKQHCRENLVAYKVPRHIEFRDDLPKSNVGKILRRELR